MLESFGTLANAAVLVVALVVLSQASKVTISNSIKAAEATKLTKTSAGFILVAFSTSLPELFIAIFAVLEPGDIAVSIGNVLGSNIVNICLVLGICFVVSLVYRINLKTLSEMAEEEWGSLHFGLLIASVIPLVLLYLGYASRFFGVILLAIFFYYMYRLSKSRAKAENSSPQAKKTETLKFIALTFLGATIVVLCSFFIVDSSSFLAVSFGFPKVLIGATIVAFGTSIPELATSLDSVRRGEINIALGTIVGSCFINITAILGVTLVASPLVINVTAFSEVTIFSLMANLLLWYFFTSKRIGKLEGVVLLLLYALFLAVTISSLV